MVNSKSKAELNRWGIISAPFGKASNITHYAQKVLLSYILDFGTNDKISKRKGQYSDGVQQFKNQLAKVEGIQRRIGTVSQKYNKDNNQLQQILMQIQAQEKICNALSLQVERINHEWQEAIDLAKTSAAQIEQMQQSIADAKNAIKKIQVDYQSILQAARKAENVLYQMTILDEAFWKMYDSKLEAKNTKAQVLNPWFTVEYNWEREKLFHLALQVHKNFFWPPSPAFSTSRISL